MRLSKKAVWLGLLLLGGQVGGISALSRTAPLQFLNIPVTRQFTEYSCGAASVASALGYYGVERREQDLMKQMGTNETDGTDHVAMLATVRAEGLKARLESDLTLDDLRAWLAKKQVAIIEMQAWSEAPTDYRTEWNSGHYVVLSGMDRDNIYFMDPAVMGGRGFLPHKDFLERWHDVSVDTVKLNHSALLLEGKPNPPAVWERIQ